MKKYLIWNTRPFYPPTRKWALASYKEPAIRTRVKIKAWLSRIADLFDDDFKRWLRDLAPIVIFILALIVPFLPKPIFNVCCYVLLLIFAGWFFLLSAAMPFACLGVFIYFCVVCARELDHPD
ncbi:hypothetical protein JXB22_08200 [candidate division WOR-3 bacterium]|nr:hypothetical protein [candidate division WOR-3 bacterium]